MNFSWETLAAALESPQGSTFYALLALLLLSAASLWLVNRAKPGTLTHPVSFTLAVLMGLRLVEASAFAFAWSGDPVAAQTMAPLERGLHLITLLALAWLWTRPSADQRRVSMNFGVALLAALVVAWALFAAWVTGPTGSTFNYTDADYTWGIACLVALLIAILRVVKARQTAGLVVFGILLLGQTAHLLLAEPVGNMPLATQAALLLTLPLLFLLPVRKSVNITLTDQPAKGSVPPAASQPDLGAEQGTPEEGGFFEFDQIETEETPAVPADALARQTAERLNADLCVFANIDEAAGELKLEIGFNLLRGSAIEPSGIPLGEVPRLRTSLASSLPLRLSAEERLPELWALSKALRLSFQAHLLAWPLEIGDGRSWVLLLLRLEQAWDTEDELKLMPQSVDLSAAVAKVIGEEAEARVAIPGMPLSTGPAADLQTQLEKLEAENEHYRQDVEQLLGHIDELETKPGSQPTWHGSELVEGLQVENERLKEALAAVEGGSASAVPGYQGIDAAQAREELRLAMEEVARLHEDLAAAQPAPLPEQPAGPSPLPISARQVEVIASIAQELRQPLSSVVGYTDLLLGESVGILGALQRKFLERVRSSTERMNTLIDNLIRIAELDEAGYSATRKPVDLSEVIDDAIGLLRPQFQEKRLALRVDLPEHLPELNTDRDALQQILYHLLLNADAATPAEGEITLRAVTDNQKDLGDFVLIQVSDSGGGIPEEDLPRVFSRVYRSRNPVVPGVGDTGVGLSIAETLTQALGGRIWVESEAGVGAIFSILLPLSPSEGSGVDLK